MEKDYFQDRPIQCTQRDYINIGDEAIICLKAAQKYANELSDLTRITVSAHLTSHQEHPRGIKLKGTTLKRDIRGNILSTNEMSIPLGEAVGRCTYPIKSGLVITKNGSMTIANIGNKLQLINPVKEDLYAAAIIFQGGNFTVDAKVNPYIYVRKSEILDSISNISLDFAVTNGRHVFVRDNFGQMLALEIRDIKGEFSETEQVLPIECYGTRPFIEK